MQIQSWRSFWHLELMVVCCWRWSHFLFAILTNTSGWWFQWRKGPVTVFWSFSGSERDPPVGWFVSPTSSSKWRQKGNLLANGIVTPLLMRCKEHKYIPQVSCFFFWEVLLCSACQSKSAKQILYACFDRSSSKSNCSSWFGTTSVSRIPYTCSVVIVVIES